MGLSIHHYRAIKNTMRKDSLVAWVTRDEQEFQLKVQGWNHC